MRSRTTIYSCSSLTAASPAASVRISRSIGATASVDGGGGKLQFAHEYFEATADTPGRGLLTVFGDEDDTVHVETDSEFSGVGQDHDRM